MSAVELAATRTGPLAGARGAGGAGGAGKVKISMNLLRADLEALRRWAEADGTTMTEIVRRALVTLRYLETEVRRGSQVVLQRDGERDRELVLGPPGTLH
jgi:hypothetical protein